MVGARRRKIRASPRRRPLRRPQIEVDLANSGGRGACPCPPPSVRPAPLSRASRVRVVTPLPVAGTFRRHLGTHGGVSARDRDAPSTVRARNRVRVATLLPVAGTFRCHLGTHGRVSARDRDAPKHCARTQLGGLCTAAVWPGRHALDPDTQMGAARDCDFQGTGGGLVEFGWETGLMRWC